MKNTKMRFVRNALAATVAALCVPVLALAQAPLAQPATALIANPAAMASRPNLESLEQVFWMCDYVATVRGMAMGDMTECQRVSDEFTQARFGGDFKAFLKWWQAAKPREHEKVRQAQP